jgi:ribosomal protein RSM22 (predicted rRNA methylase)
VIVVKFGVLSALWINMDHGAVDYRGQVAASQPGLPGARSVTAAVQAALTGSGTGNLGASVQRLIAAYRAGDVPAAPVITSRLDAAAYAAYRMPATAAATAAALHEMRLSLPGWAPLSLVDFGAGTGGSAWAVASDLPSIEAITMLEQSPDAIRLGRAIFAQAQSEALRSATWLPWRLGESDDGKADPPTAELATVCYVLGELTPAQQAALTMLAASAAPAVLLVEPGTPAGHRRILAARARLLSSGYQVAAPCPHELGCPLDVEGDWCHFAARLQRSAMHRQAKGAELAYEDEKFSYIAAIRAPASRATAHRIGAGPPDLPDGRVVRRPQQRKGLVMLDLCRADGTSSRELVSKSKGESYRRARKTTWGDRWGP